MSLQTEKGRIYLVFLQGYLFLETSAVQLKAHTSQEVRRLQRGRLGTTKESQQVYQTKLRSNCCFSIASRALDTSCSFEGPFKKLAQTAVIPTGIRRVNL